MLGAGGAGVGLRRLWARPDLDFVRQVPLDALLHQSGRAARVGRAGISDLTPVIHSDRTAQADH